MRRKELLALLWERPETYLSGEELARRLGVTRAAVWKLVAALRSEGYSIESATNRGYRLAKGPPRLTAEEITARLRTKALGRELVLLDSVDSTNVYLRRMADAGAPEGTTVFARCQTGGRGRAGRGFQSPADKGIYFSCLLRPKLPRARLMSLTGLVAVALCDGIERAAGLRPGIKWVNDLVIEGRKLCGILTELSLVAESGEVEYAVVGAGINLSQRAEDFEGEVREKAVSLSMAAGRPVDPAPLAAAMLEGMEEMYDRLCAGEDDTARYRADCVTLGREVRLLRGGGGEPAFAEDVDGSLGLMVRFPDGRRETVQAGEVSVRGANGYVF